MRGMSRRWRRGHFALASPAPRWILRRMSRRPCAFLLCVFLGLATWARATPALPAIDGAPDTLVSFHYDGAPDGPRFSGWTDTRSERQLDAQRREHTRTLTDPRTGLEVRIVFVVYQDFPAVEWTVYLKNTGSDDTPILSDIRALDFTWTQPAEAKEFFLRHPAGTFLPPSAADYQPLEQALPKGQSAHFAPQLGRPTGKLMPFFNLDFGDRSGVILALGWPGAWAVDFTRDDTTGVRVRAGQELTHLRLHPGEEIRTPLVVIQTWQGDWIEAQNQWRRWLRTHNMPQPGGQSPGPWLAASNSEPVHEMVRRTAANQREWIDRYLEEKIPLDLWWMDAGWYENAGRWQEPIAWRPDRTRFPDGLRGVTDHAHARGLKTLAWFEPERVMPTNELFRDHPDWLLRNPTPGLISRLLYLGDPAARAWLTDLIDRRITEEGLDVYRQDFCIIEPAAIWRGHDAPDRQGITENHHLTGYLAFWDELRRRHPNLIIDSCAGGGSRNDLETLRRALPLWRSDYAFDPSGNQAQTYGLAPWWPFYGTATGPDQLRSYELRSNLTSPLAIVAWNVADRTLPYAALRRAVQDWREYAPNYAGDFYPLTPWSLDANVWMAWQFDRPEAGRGVIQAFRRPAALERTLRVKLRGLDPAATYEFTELDEAGTHPTRTATGREAMETGLEITCRESPAAVNLVYAKLP